MHREAQILFAADGLMQVTTPKGRWLVPPTRAVWLPPLIAHSVDVLADIELRALLIEPAWLATHPRAPRLGREFVARVAPLLRETILALFEERADAQRLEALAQVTLFELVEAEDGATFMPLPSDPRARRVAEWLLADPTSMRELGDFARASGTSARTLTRLFAAETGITFKEWRQRARILAAIETLGEGAMSIKQIAAKLGFSSAAAFSHAFRQVIGVAPTSFGRDQS
jgi:transcriptional regulator GlxA family with amidase domain